MTSSTDSIFCVTGPLLGESTGHGELWCFRWSARDKLSKQSRRRRFETPSRSLERHCNVLSICESRCVMVLFREKGCLNTVRHYFIVSLNDTRPMLWTNIAENWNFHQCSPKITDSLAHTEWCLFRCQAESHTLNTNVVWYTYVRPRGQMVNAVNVYPW